MAGSGSDLGAPVAQDGGVAVPSNLDTVRRVVAAFNSRDVEELIAMADPDVDLHSAFSAAISGTVYHGHKGIRSWHRDLDEAWDEISLQPVEYCELGDRVLACYRMRGRGRQSGVEIEMAVAHVMTFRDGLVVRLKAYGDRNTALRETGVAESTLAPFAP